MKVLLIVGLIMLGPSGRGVAYADSEGYYCMGRGYLAYQFGMAAPPAAPHRLYVVRTAGPTGIPEAVVLELPQFQVHGMRCGAGWIDVRSFNAVYHVILDKDDRPVRYEAQPAPDGQAIPREFILSQLQNLGPWRGGRAYRKPVRASLGVKERGGQYLLEINATVVPPLEKCELAITSRIVETDRNGREINARIIFQGGGHRECGE
jgi:hypothetical protein